MQETVMSKPALSVNERAGRLVDRLLADKALYGVSVRRGVFGQVLIDAGVTARGGIEAGLLMAEICMGGLGRVALSPRRAASAWKWAVAVNSSHPVLACLGSQYAGWNLSHGEGAAAYNVLGSGPGRAMARKEPLFEELGYRDFADRAIFVLEASAPPPEALVQKIAADCRLAPRDLVFIYAPTQSLSGTVQVVARVLEVALHRRICCISRWSASWMGWARLRCRRRAETSPPRWAAPTTPSSSAAMCSFS
jgi:methenyltetrahydromethanopterin cyclohydrolase